MKPADRWFLAAALAVVLLGGGMAVYLATQAGNGPAGVQDLQSYHIEAVVTTDGATPDRLVRIWYRAPDKLRIEVGEDGQAPSVYVIENDTLHVYDAQSNTYYDRPKPDDALTARGNTTLALGPLPATTLQAYFDAQQGGTWALVGSDHVLGKKTEIVERGLRTVAEGTLARYWIDPRYLFVLRYESDTPKGKTTWQPTLVEYNPKVDLGLFEFRPPAGWRQAAPTSPAPQTSPSAGITSYSLPNGFLRPGYVPDGYQLANVSQSATSGSAGDSLRITLRFNGRAAGGSAPSFVIEQSTGGAVEQPLAGAMQVDVNGAAAYEAESNGVRTLAWQAVSAGQKLSIVLRSPDLSYEELVKVARSMK